jgi:hypothetical protein
MLDESVQVYALQVSRLIPDTSGHEEDERDEQRGKVVLAVIALGGRNRGDQDFDEHNDFS